MTAFDVAQRLAPSLKERPGAEHHPFIQWAHSLCRLGFDQPDELAWCSSFVVAVAHICGLQSSYSAAARSWMAVGKLIGLGEAEPGNDIVILSRGDHPASGHVGFYAGHDEQSVMVLGGNQGNAVTMQQFPRSRILGVRRLA